jgi:ribose transport system permease protein
VTAPAVPSGQPVARRLGALTGGRHFSPRLGLVAFLLLEIIAFTMVTGDFLTASNMFNTGRAVAILSIVAVGATFGLISGALDLSIGSVIALGGTVATHIAIQGWPVGIAVAGAVAAGLLVGFTNGFVVVKLRVNPIIATLAMLGIARGVAFIIDGGTGVVGNDSRRTGPGFDVMQQSVGPVPVPLIVAIIAIVCGGAALAYTRFGRYAYAVGGSPSASRAVALPVDRLRVSYLVLSGTLAGFAGWVFASMASGVGSNIAVGYELTAITAVILGGVGLAGGRGSMVGTALGVIIIGVMVNGLTLAGVPVFYQLMGQGFVLLAAVALDAARSGGYR